MGIGGGPNVDGQVRVFHDLLGVFVNGFEPRFVKRYANLGEQAVAAISEFVQEVQSGTFPAPEHGFAMKQGEGDKLQGVLSQPTRGTVADGLVASEAE